MFAKRMCFTSSGLISGVTPMSPIAQKPLLTLFRSAILHPLRMSSGRPLFLRNYPFNAWTQERAITKKPPDAGAKTPRRLHIVTFWKPSLISSPRRSEWFCYLVIFDIPCITQRMWSGKFLSGGMLADFFFLAKAFTSR